MVVQRYEVLTLDICDVLQSFAYRGLKVRQFDAIVVLGANMIQHMEKIAGHLLPCAVRRHPCRTMHKADLSGFASFTLQRAHNFAEMRTLTVTMGQFCCNA